MTPVKVTNRTTETEPPESVRLKRFAIDKVHYLMANSYGGIDLCATNQHGIIGRYSLKDAKNLAVATIALVSAWEGQFTAAPVEVVDVQRELALADARELIKKLEALLPRLRGTAEGGGT